MAILWFSVGEFNMGKALPAARSLLAGAPAGTTLTIQRTGVHVDVVIKLTVQADGTLAEKFDSILPPDELTDQQAAREQAKEELNEALDNPAGVG
jgi:hypothetical protein